MLRVEIRARGQIDAHWSSWFEGLTVTHTAQDETILTGDVTDQAAFYGLLAKLRDLGLPLVSATSTEVSGQGDAQPTSLDDSNG